MPRKPKSTQTPLQTVLQYFLEGPLSEAQQALVVVQQIVTSRTTVISAASARLREASGHGTPAVVATPVPSRSRARRVAAQRATEPPLPEQGERSGENDE